VPHPRQSIVADVGSNKLLAGGTEDWQVLLNVASGLIPVLVQERMRLIMSESTDPEHKGNQAQRGTRCHENDCGISVLLGSFLSIDIISCASTRSAPFFHVDHVQALRDLGIPLEYITGCKRSVMVLISEISSLDRWKKEFEACHKLSIVDLVKRGGQIEERLRQELVELGHMQTTGSSLRNPSAIRLTPIYPQVGQLFTLSAIIYLHVAISGAHPELPEIAEAVSKTIPLFKFLKEPGLLYSVIWPFCISGCLALEEHQGFFRELYSASGITNSAFGTCCEAFKMMEKCWHARKTGSHNFDWVSTMNQNGNFVLLR
jgi:Fungal specific transcription factor domain